ncbi:hypothetical protein LV779_39135 [Streptomyces thinghirensis]|nr:hypothetical protein [Streptomyces thinghirensis]
MAAWSAATRRPCCGSSPTPVSTSWTLPTTTRPTSSCCPVRTERVDAARAAFESAGVRAVRLNVSAPFHSRHMRDTAEEFACFLDGFTLRDPAVPVAGQRGRAAVRPRRRQGDPDRADRLPVRWTDTVRRLMGHGDFEFVELGPGRVLDQSGRQDQEERGAAARARSGGTARRATARRPTAVLVRPVSFAAPTADTLGAATFRERYRPAARVPAGRAVRRHLRPARCWCGGQAGLLGFLGTGGLPLTRWTAGCATWPGNWARAAPSASTCCTGTERPRRSRPGGPAPAARCRLWSRRPASR